jgi:3-hydroxymyristoyl/3-hydroxydecanoyl-(acyl carrier protein) dehydratase
MKIPIIHQEWNLDRSVCKLQLKINGDLPFFSGHFPAKPIVPGAFQIQWAIDQSIRLGFLGQGEIQVNSTKFKAMMIPDTLVWLELKKRENKVTTFKYFTDDKIFSMGNFST